MVAKRNRPLLPNAGPFRDWRMPVLVTRPHPDDEATASGLRARGYEVLQAPMLRFEPIAFSDDNNGHYGGVIVTSAKDRKSTRLNSSHLVISYAVFCLKKKKNTTSYADRLRPIPMTRNNTTQQRASNVTWRFSLHSSLPDHGQSSLDWTTTHVPHARNT